MDMKISNDELLYKYNVTKDPELLKKIVENNIYLAEIISKKFVNRGVDYDDLYQIACLGLVKAAKRFDYSKDVKFSTYATPTIVGEIKRYFRDKRNVIRIPRRIYELVQKIKSARHDLTHNLGREPTVEEIAQFINVSEDNILEALESSTVTSPQSLDQTVSIENETSLEEILGREDPIFDSIENKDYILKSIEELNDMEKDFVKERFINNKTQKQIAESFGVSQMYISRMERKVITKLKRYLS